jgi:hypothetical protein
VRLTEISHATRPANVYAQAIFRPNFSAAHTADLNRDFLALDVLGLVATSTADTQILTLHFACMNVTASGSADIRDERIGGQLIDLDIPRAAGRNMHLRFMGLLRSEPFPGDFFGL